MHCRSTKLSGSRRIATRNPAQARGEHNGEKNLLAARHQLDTLPCIPASLICNLSFSVAKSDGMRRKVSECTSRVAFPLPLFCFFMLLVLVCPAVSGQTAPADADARTQFTTLMAEGSRALQGGDNAAAEKSFRQALVLAPDSVEILNNLAISLARQGRDSEAISLYKHALQLKPGDPITSRNLGVAYFRAHRYQDARPLLESFAKTDPTFQSLDLTGIDLFALDQYSAAVAYLERASSLNPNDIPTLDILGKAYWREKNYSGVTRVFDRIMAINPESPEAHFMLGLAYDVMYREQEAFKEFRAALSADPNYPGVHSSLGLIAWREHKVPDAEAEFREELTRYPNDPTSNYMMGQILRQQEQPALAIPYLQAAIVANPAYRDALFELGQCYLMLNQPKSALEPLEKATEADPTFDQPHFVLARAFSMLGRSADAARERNICKQIQAQQHAMPSAQ
jgi:Flp pilus assembly protein TadD